MTKYHFCLWMGGKSIFWLSRDTYVCHLLCTLRNLLFKPVETVPLDLLMQLFVMCTKSAPHAGYIDLLKVGWSDGYTAAHGPDVLEQVLWDLSCTLQKLDSRVRAKDIFSHCIDRPKCRGTRCMPCSVHISVFFLTNCRNYVVRSRIS